MDKPNLMFALGTVYGGSLIGLLDAIGWKPYLQVSWTWQVYASLIVISVILAFVVVLRR